MHSDRSFQTQHPDASLRALLVEDDIDDLMILSDTLLDASESEVEIESAFCLETAERLMREQDFDVVLLDLNLSDSGGVHTVRAVRRCIRNASIVVVSGSEDPDAAEQCMREGALAYIRKSQLKREVLMDALLTAWERAQDRKMRELEIALEQHRMALYEVHPRESQEAMGSLRALRMRAPDLYAECARRYRVLLSDYFLAQAERGKVSEEQLTGLVGYLGELSCDATDLRDIHLEALHLRPVSEQPIQPEYVSRDAQYLLLEVMGRLLHFYRSLKTRGPVH